MADANFIGPTVKLTNDTCVAVRYSITNAEKHKVEAIIVDTISLIPTKGVTLFFNALTVKGILTNAVGLAAQKTSSPYIQWGANLLDPEKNKEGLLYPRESVERKAAAQSILNRNSVKVEYLTFDDKLKIINLTTFITDDLAGLPGQTQELKLSAILKEIQQGKRPHPVQSPPSPWKAPVKQSINMGLDDSCVEKWRLLRIPELRLERGQCTVEAFKSSHQTPDGVFCNTVATGDNKELFPYTFTENVGDHTTLGRGEWSQSMIYFDGPSGRRNGCQQRLMNGCIPVVALFNCDIKKEGEPAEKARGNGKRTSEQVLSWLWEEMKSQKRHEQVIRGKRYWAISWDGSDKIYGLKETSDHSVLGRYILIKRRGYTAFMVCDDWTSLQ